MAAPYTAFAEGLPKTNLQALPAELIAQIASKLEMADIRSIRQTCHNVNAKTWHRFASSCFSTLAIDFRPERFALWREIANHEKLRLYVRKMQVGGYCGPRAIQRSGEYFPLGWGLTWAREQSGCLDTAAPVFAEFRELLATRFTNCRSVQLLDMSGTYPFEGTIETLSAADALSLVLFAMANLPFEELHFKFVRMWAFLNAHQLPSHVVNLAIFSVCWATHLTSLYLHFYVEEDMYDVTIAFIQNAKSLRRLLLDTGQGSPGFLCRLFQAIDLPHISHLAIWGLSGIKPAALSSYICRFSKTLHTLSIGMITLLDFDDWSSVFSDLGANLTGLESIEVFDLSCIESVRRAFFPIFEWQEAPLGKIEFGQIYKHGKDGSATISFTYHGERENMHMLLLLLAKSVYIMSPLIPRLIMSSPSGKFLVGAPSNKFLVGGKLEVRKSSEHPRRHGLFAD